MGSWLASDPETLQSGANSARRVMPARLGLAPYRLFWIALYPCYPYCYRANSSQLAKIVFRRRWIGRSAGGC